MEGKKMSAREKIAYLRGLIEGQNIAENAGMSKFHEALLGAFEAITEEIDEIASEQADMREYVEDLEDEMMSIDGASENDAYDSEDDDAFDEDEDEDLLCPHCGKPFKQ
jgi:fructose-1,6-bisphosphatase